MNARLSGGDLQTNLPPPNKPIFLPRVKAICFCPYCSQGRALPSPGWELGHHGKASRVRAGCGIGPLGEGALSRGCLKGGPS